MELVTWVHGFIPRPSFNISTVPFWKVSAAIRGEIGQICRRVIPLWVVAVAVAIAVFAVIIVTAFLSRQRIRNAFKSRQPEAVAAAEGGEKEEDLLVATMKGGCVGATEEDLEEEADLVRTVIALRQMQSELLARADESRFMAGAPVIVLDDIDGQR